MAGPPAMELPRVNVQRMADELAQQRLEILLRSVNRAAPRTPWERFKMRLNRIMRWLP
jgi:hypothetical protein